MYYVLHWSCVLLISTEETFAFVSWPNEGDTVSVISNLRRSVSGPFVVGEECEVVDKKELHTAKVHATGTYMYMYMNLAN